MERGETELTVHRIRCSPWIMLWFLIPRSGIKTQARLMRSHRQEHPTTDTSEVSQMVFTTH